MLLYDGECGFCGWAVRRVLRGDRAARFRVAPLGSAVATALLLDRGLPADPETVVLIVGDRALVRSDAVLGVVRRLGGWWHLLRIGALLPRRLRDAAYDGIARHRGRISRRLGTRPISAAERAADPRFLA